jgi:hypothetical protein
MAVAFFGAIPLTRVSNKTGIGADVVSCLAAVVTVMPLYVAATPGPEAPFPSSEDGLVYSGPERSRARRLRAQRTLDGEDRCGKWIGEEGGGYSSFSSISSQGSLKAISSG